MHLQLTTPAKKKRTVGWRCICSPQLQQKNAPVAANALAALAPKRKSPVVASASAALESNTTSDCGCWCICNPCIPKEATARRPPSQQRAALPRMARSVLLPLTSTLDRSQAERFRCGTWKGFVRVCVPSSLHCGGWRIFSVCPPRFATGSERAEFVHLNLRPVGSKVPFRSGRKEKDGIVWGLCWNSVESKFQRPGRPGAPVPWRLKKKLKTRVWTPIFSDGSPTGRSSFRRGGPDLHPGRSQSLGIFL